MPPHVAPGAIGLLRRLDFHLFRRVIEVRDGLLLLRPPLDADVWENTTSLDDHAEAVAIARAIGTLRSDTDAVSVNRTGPAGGTPTDTQARGELERLERLAVAYQIVRERTNDTSRRSHGI